MKKIIIFALLTFVCVGTNAQRVRDKARKIMVHG